MAQIDQDDLTFLQALLARRSGFSLDSDRSYLIEARLLPLARREGLVGVSTLISKLRSPHAERLERAAVEAMLLTDTCFFRDGEPFDSFATHMLPALMLARQETKTIRIWCAGCASGQEPVSLAILLAESGGLLGDWTFEIVATDLSSAAIARARSGHFSHFDVQTGLTIHRHLDWFMRDGEGWRLDRGILNRVSYSVHNLLEDCSSLGKFDVVFCRNVLRFMTDAARADVAQRLHQAVAEDGYVVLGAQEERDELLSAGMPVQGLRAAV